jgi:hypothetical protein
MKKDINKNKSLIKTSVTVSLFDKNDIEIKEGDLFKTGWTKTLFVVKKIDGVLCIDKTPLKTTLHTWGEVIKK